MCLPVLHSLDGIAGFCSPRSVYRLLGRTVFSENPCQLVFILSGLRRPRQQVRQVFVLTDASFITLVHVPVYRFIRHLLQTLIQQLLRFDLTPLSLQLAYSQQLFSGVNHFFLLICFCWEIPASVW